MGMKTLLYSNTPRHSTFEDESSDDDDYRQHHRFPKKPFLDSTSVGCIFNGGVVLGTVSKTNKEKIYKLGNSILCCGIGNSVLNAIEERLFREQFQLYNGIVRIIRSSFVNASFSNPSLQRLLFRYDHGDEMVGASFIVGGVDSNGPHVYRILPHESIECIVGYTAIGTRNISVRSVFESHWNPNLIQHEAIQLVRDTLNAACYPTRSIVEIEIINEPRQSVQQPVQQQSL